MPFEIAHSKLSENHKIIEIGSTKLELWPLKTCFVDTVMHIDKQLYISLL